MPRVHGTIKRRLLINFRVDPCVVQKLLPAPFQPKLHRGQAIAGICLIRLEGIRPRGFPRLAGLSSENAAHRIAVTWEDRHGAHEGVYIPRRDTGSLVNHLAGGRVFPGEHQRARFRVLDADDRIALHMRSADGNVDIDLVARTAHGISTGSSFDSTDDASAFFERGSLGYSATASGDHLDGIALHTLSWQVEPLDVEHVRSSYFADPSRFPEGSVAFDSGLIMRNIRHEWAAVEELALPASSVGTPAIAWEAQSRTSHHGARSDRCRRRRASGGPGSVSGDRRR
jgi:hypothetical protein